MARSRSPLPPDFSWLFALSLLCCGIALTAWGIAGSLSPHWIIADIPDSRSPDPVHQFEIIAERDAIYEIELAYRSPNSADARKALVAAQRDRISSGLEWSVRNPRGRVAAGGDGEVLYVVRDMATADSRLKHFLLASPFLPPAGEILPWLFSGPGNILVGIGQWRARQGQSYSIEVDLSSLSAPESEARFRVRARRLTWDAHLLESTPRVYAGLLLMLLAGLVWAARLVTARRRRQ